MIIEKETARHYFWGDTCESWVYVETAGLSVKEERMPGGTSEKLHFHSEAQQFFFILKGSAAFYLEGEKVEVAERRGLLIKPQTKHFIANEAAETLEFLVISQPSTDHDRTPV